MTDTPERQLPPVPDNGADVTAADGKQTIPPIDWDDVDA